MTAANTQHRQAIPDTWSTDWWRRLGEVFIVAAKDFLVDNAPQWAAAIAYYSLLSFFPLLIAAVSLAAYFVDPQWATDQITNLLGAYLPRGTVQVERIVQNVIESRGTAGLLSFISLLWSGTRVFSTLTVALNISFDVDESYSFIKRTLVELVMLLSLGLFFIQALTAPLLLDLLWDTLEFLPGGESVIFAVLTRALPALLFGLALFLLYHFVPRRAVDWRAALGGAAVATLLLALARPLFLMYVRQFASYNLIYGSIAIVVIMVFWAWIVALITLFGAEIAGHSQSMLVDGKSPPEVRQAHSDRAPSRRRS